MVDPGFMTLCSVYIFCTIVSPLVKKHADSVGCFDCSYLNDTNNNNYK